MLQKFIPIFPLSLVAYPGEKMNLHIFEPRYKQLIKECVDEEKTFAIPVIDKNAILEYGTEMKINSVEKTYDEGEMDIKVEGLQVVRVLEVIKEVPDKLYSGAVVSVMENIEDHHSKTKFELEELALELFKLLDIKEDVVKEGFTFKSFKLAHYVGFNLLEEFELLRHPRETARQKLIIEHIKKILPAVKQVAEIREKAKLNGHFRMEYPPEFL
ncbi:MAG: LON peptidase substrate-binding domain-containing protein [Fimbriimonadaceae bacterium]|nr:LON peptidase substrate-binding domain-containing protein [Chitinophagales bacterium]